MDSADIGLDTLVDLDGSILEQEGGYRIRIEARRVPTSDHAEYGIRYSLTLHDKDGTRVLGDDNAHAVKPPKKFKFAGQRLPYDHRHRTSSDKGVPYADLNRRRQPLPAESAADRGSVSSVPAASAPASSRGQAIKNMGRWKPRPP